MKSALLTFLTLALLVYAVLCAYLYVFQRSLIYFPTPARDGVPAEDLWLENGNERLHAWRVNAGQADAIIYFGGNAEDVALNMRQFTDIFPLHTVYLINYRGYGKSTGVPSEAALYSDAEAIFAFAAGNHRTVSLIGRSLGASVATYLAASREVHRVVLITPFDNLANLAASLYPMFPTRLLLREQHDSLSRAPHIEAPVLILVAGRDEIIPRDNSQRLARAIDPSLVSIQVIEDTLHNTIGTVPEYGRALQSFINAPAGSTAGCQGRVPG